MNERIKALAEQAGMVVGSYANDGSDVWMEGLKTPGALEKFAELIVRECVDVGSQWADGLIDSDHYSFVNKKIKEYFGVK